MTASRRKSAQGLQLDEIFLDGAQDRAGFWSDEVAASRVLSSRKDIGDFGPVQARPANDDGRRPRRPAGTARGFVGAQHFWLACAASLAFCLLFASLMSIGSSGALVAAWREPGQHPDFWAALMVIAVLPWMFALAAHRQAMNKDILDRVLLAAQRFQEPSALAEDAGRRMGASFEHVFADIDARMALLDEKSAALANRIAATMLQSTHEADANIANMRNIVDSGEAQREALQRTGMMLSTEVLPVISKLETTVASLEGISQNAGAMLETLGSRLQQSTQQMKACLDGFNSANHNVVPDIEKRMLKFETSIARLPEQLDATIGRLSPMSETIADAAMLSTANIEVIDQITKDLAAALEKSRASFAELSASGVAQLHQAVEAQAGRFREMLEQVLTEEAARVSGLSRELDQLADTANSAVDRLQQPVNDMTGATERAKANAHEAINALERRIEASLSGCVAQINEASARLASQLGREIETSAVGLQTRLAATSTELMQRVGADTARFENIIGETAERSSSRIAAALKEVPGALAQRMDTEIAKIDGALKGSIFGLSDQMRQIIDAVPSRLSAMTRETLLALESNLERSIDEVALRTDSLNEQFRKNATETTEAVLQGYVDFIYLAVDRFRSELEAVNGNFSRELTANLGALPRGVEARASMTGEPPSA